MKPLTPMQKVYLERIYRLFELAEHECGDHPERSRRYIELARKLSTKSTVSIPTELKKQFCKRCGIFLKEGANAVWSEKEKWIEIECEECGFVVKRKK